MSSPAIVTGILTRNPQLSRTGDGTPVVNPTLADNSRRQVEGEWVDGPTTFWDIVCFGPQADNIITSLTKGARVIAVGVFRTRTRTTADGEERSRGRGPKSARAGAWSAATGGDRRQVACSVPKLAWSPCDLVFGAAQATRWYSLITPPRTRCRWIGASSGMTVAGSWLGGRCPRP
jgi:Single-strand binding protein family